MKRKLNAGKVRYWVLLWLALLSPAHGYEMHWGYEGAEGPSHWGDIKPEFATCKTGTHQSPINIVGAQRAELPPLKFDYRPVPLDVVNNGHTIQVNVEAGSTFATGDRVYRLVQWHFHAPSEHRVKGRHHDLEVHFVHMDSERNIAVAAVFFDAGRESRALAPIWSRLPEKEGRAVRDTNTVVDLMTLLPADRSYYTFESSLTTPPCTEGVKWFVLKHPLELSAAQLARFARLYRHNERPLQPLNGRLISESAD